MGSTVRITPTHNAFAWGGPKSKLSGEKWRITLVNPAIPATPGGRLFGFFWMFRLSTSSAGAMCGPVRFPQMPQFWPLGPNAGTHRFSFDPFQFVS